MRLKLDDDRINEICRQFGIRRLYLVGSNARGTQRHDSDVDLVVMFEQAGSSLHQYMGAKTEFEATFQCGVDLIEEDAIHNPHFLRSVDEDKVLIYEA